jgi:putative NADH-flavin reductase
MIVAVFGASSRTGRAFIPIAAEAGLLQRLQYRTASPDPSPDTATVVVGALTDPTAVREVLRGADAALVLLGPKPDARGVFCATAMKAIIAGMRTQEVPRVLCVMPAIVGELSGVGLPLKLMSFGLRKSGQAEVLNDRDEQDRLVRTSKKSWTLIKPHKLTDAAGGEYDAGPTVSVGLSSQISRASLARFLVSELQQPQFAEQTVYVRDR